MTPTQLRAALTKAGLSQRGAARLLGIDERTMRRYCAGDLPVPRVVELALREVARE
ncbi:MAG: helix-turn-helix domain-containing protein [Gammaproteobacteria bacterium]|nr:helix-turn-helix domain-containing protein [Gammaproteobacteria bacterium]